MSLTSDEMTILSTLVNDKFEKINEKLDLKIDSVNQTIAAGSVNTSVSLDAMSREMSRMNATLTDHNGRLRDNEVKQLLLDKDFCQYKKDLAGLSGVQEVSDLNIKSLKRLNDIVVYIQNHPWKIGSIMFLVSTTILSLALFFFELLNGKL